MNRKREKETRKVNPFWGLTGIFGLIGVAGFPIYQRTGITYPFLFFAFFGLFGLFFEGKMSNTLKDEMYMENRKNAENKALTIGFKLVFAGMFILAIIENRIANKSYILIGIEIFISLVIAYVIFATEYLTYKYDFECEKGEE